MHSHMLLLLLFLFGTLSSCMHSHCFVGAVLTVVCLAHSHRQCTLTCIVVAIWLSNILSLLLWCDIDVWLSSQMHSHCCCLAQPQVQQQQTQSQPPQQQAWHWRYTDIERLTVVLNGRRRQFQCALAALVVAVLILVKKVHMRMRVRIFVPVMLAWL